MYIAMILGSIIKKQSLIKHLRYAFETRAERMARKKFQSWL